jgi:hypothetical protein
MSVPINHHYVSQGHQREFFNDADRAIYVYDKQRKNLYKKTTTKSLFSEDNLNTRGRSSGRIDFSSLETELKILFEDDFPKLVARTKSFVLNPKDAQEVYENVLGWFVLMGIIGELRHPHFKRRLDNIMLQLGPDVLHMASGIDGNKVTEYLKAKQTTPYNNDLSYVETALRIFERMEPIEYEFFVIETDSHFILPDTSCFQTRGQLQRYPNPFIKEIVEIGIPLTDKIFLFARSSKLGVGRNGIQYIQKEDHERMVNEINRQLFDFAQKSVACKDKDYLKKFIDTEIENNKIER